MFAGKNVLGIDIGSVAVSVAVVSSDKEIRDSCYRFHYGDLTQCMRDVLAEVDLENVGYVAATGSTPNIIAAAKHYDNQVATISGATHYHPDVQAILVVGGEKFFLSTFDEQGNYRGSTCNTSCAAGTGSFLDQQASRLKMTGIEELSSIACDNSGSCPKIASRCAVFAKTDLIHAQQEGYRFAEISDGLCQGLAKNIVDTLFIAENIPAEILFCGGVSKNRAVARHIEKLASVRLRVDDLGHLYGAIGAAFCFLDDDLQVEPHFQISAADILRESRKEKTYAHPPLELLLSRYPDFSTSQSYLFPAESNNPVEVDIYAPHAAGTCPVYLGVDIGSTSTKAVLIDENNTVYCGFYTRTAGRPLEAVQNIFRAIDSYTRQTGGQFTVVSCAATGSGRKFVGKIIGADLVVDEITAHARAATQLNPLVDTIIEIGGQDSKFTTLKNGRVTSSTMNNVCAAGTGSFIEEQAARLGCAIEEYSDRAENVMAPLASGRCTVFMERDINHHLSEGFSVDEVLASALHSVRENYLMKVACEKNIGDVIFFQGATAKNKALVAAFEQRLQKPILVSEYCHLTGALGAALLVKEEVAEPSSLFKGFSLYKTEIPVSSEVCHLCNNCCKITVADTPSGREAYGFLCGRDYETRTYVKRKNTSYDLLRERKRLLEPTSSVHEKSGLVIGLPAAVHMVEELHFWQKFFDILGIATLSSAGYGEDVARGKQLSKTEFCAPITAMHGHVDYLLKKADYVFLPFYLEKKKKDARRQYCYYTQFLPGIAATIGDSARERVLAPVIQYLYTSFHTKMELYQVLKKVFGAHIGFLDISRAYDEAVAYSNSYKAALKDFYSKRAEKTDDIEVVFVGRPYTVLSPSMNCGIPGIFAAMGINTYYQDMLQYSDDEFKELLPLLREIHWQHAAKILEVAEVIASKKGVYPVYITSFKCSPDSFVLDYFKAIMESHNKPFLILELDEHDSSVGYETRIEAAVRSFRNHHTKGEVSTAGSILHINPRVEKEIGNKDIILPNWDRITCTFLSATLRREGLRVHLMEETDRSIRESLKFNSGQCIPLNAIAQGFMDTVRNRGLDPSNSLLWLNRSTLACNIKLYPHHIKTILTSQGMGGAGVYTGNLSLTDVSARAAMNAYFSYMFGGMLRRVACRIRPYEIEKGRTDKVLEKSIQVLSDAFLGKRRREDALNEAITQFQWIDTREEDRPKVAIFGDLYVRDNRVMNQNLIRFIEQHGGEVISTPYSEYAKMIAGAYFRKWFNEGYYLSLLSSKAILATMMRLEKRYGSIFDRVLGQSLHSYDDLPKDILAPYNIAVENTGESMDNILKIHYIRKHYPEVSLFIQASPSLCCASLVTEAMKTEIEKNTGVPVVSVIYDGTGGNKNSVIIPYLRFGARSKVEEKLLNQIQL